MIEFIDGEKKVVKNLNSSCNKEICSNYSLLHHITILNLSRGANTPEKMKIVHKKEGGKGRVFRVDNF